MSPPSSLAKVCGAASLTPARNALVFDSPTLPLCPGSATIRSHRPSTRVNATATLAGNNGAMQPVTLAIDNALALFATTLQRRPAHAGR